MRRARAQQNLEIRRLGSSHFLQIDSKGISAFEQLLMARYAHYYYIAYEPKILLADLIFVTALEESLWRNFKEIGKIALAVFHIFSDLTDDELLSLDFSQIEEKKKKILDKIKTPTLKECFRGLKTSDLELDYQFIRLCSLGKKLTFNFFKSKTTAIRELEEIVSVHTGQSVGIYLCLPQALTTKTVVHDDGIKEQYNPCFAYDFSPVIRALEQKMFFDCGIVVSLVKPIPQDEIVEILNHVDRVKTDSEIKSYAILQYIKKAEQQFPINRRKWVLRRSRLFEFLDKLEKSLIEKDLIQEKTKFDPPWYSVEAYELIQKLEFLNAINEDFNLGLGNGFIPSYIYSIGEYSEEFLRQHKLTPREESEIERIIESCFKKLRRRPNLF